MENYYKILEVDKNASPEIIEKAYKTLVKKYHPDLKEGEEKIYAENKIKEINTAYDILSDELKRKEYDEKLPEQYISIDEYNLVVNENNLLKNELINLKNNLYNNPRQNYYSNANSQTNNSARDYYNNANQYDSKKVHYTRKITPEYDDFEGSNYSFKNTFKMLLVLLLCFLLVFLFFQIPYIHNLFYGIFSDNFLLLIIIIVFIYFYFFRKK